MDDESKAIKAVDRAARAKALLEDDLLREAFEALDAEFTKRWKAASSLNDRERLWVASGIAGKVRDLLISYVQNGTVATAILKDIEGKRQRRAA